MLTVFVWALMQDQAKIQKKAMNHFFAPLETLVPKILALVAVVTDAFQPTALVPVHS